MDFGVVGTIALRWFNRAMLAVGIAMAAVMAIGMLLVALLLLEVIHWPHGHQGLPIPRGFWINVAEAKGRVDRRRQEGWGEPASLSRLWKDEAQDGKGFRNLSQTLRASRGGFVERKSGKPVWLIKRNGLLGLAIDGISRDSCLFSAYDFLMFWEERRAEGKSWYIAMRVDDREMRPSEEAEPANLDYERLSEAVCGPEKEGVKLRVEWLGL